ncbi:DUF2953 domain-containing protein [Inconstantimicrobium mannanitabidum]|uniref:Uncharacterized protein n=1 Tax=Inconstantimicrobium mannanitabidum TaxID=1604901 RepID=A0ACB5RAG2_9CLOT|nr:DUF2953 domain-containing protein [Clostridium sp. TW13]GKX66180.1 hypothetical protein rsdtw13_14380 [Clostridium sp. TW13]
MKILIIVAIILLFPIPIKLRISYIDKKFKVMLFNIQLNKKKIISPEDLKKTEEKIKENNIAEKIEKSQKTIYINTAKIFIKKLKHTFYKPTLRLKFKFEYDFDNAATTALMYPFITEITSLFCTLLRIPFILKKNCVSVIYKFENSFFVNCDLSCIFIINLAKLIYIMILLLLSYIGGKKYGKSSNRKFDEVNYGKS